MRTQYIIILSAAVLLSSTFYGCSNETISGTVGTCNCKDGQVCSEAMLCYDNPACKVCTETQVCVGGECFEADDPCASCTVDQICRQEKCYDADDPCAKCESDQVCKDNACVNANDPCAQCTDTQKCVDGQCYNADDPCAKCTEAQSCIDGECKENTDDGCDPKCETSQVCINGECKSCGDICDGQCCNEGQLCDTITNKCEDACENNQPACNGDCCIGSNECHAQFGCVEHCSKNQTICENSEMQTLTCCNEGEICEDMECKEDCKGGVRCEGLCCAVGEVCEDNRCKIAYDPNTQTRCGDNDEFVCNNDSQICLYRICIPKGKPCTKSSDCDFDEFCEPSTESCINTDEIPNTCEIKPEPGKFTPIVQWHWPTTSVPGGKPGTHPTYDQVMNVPAIINLTDDNGDGKIDENDIPDLIFTSFSNTGSYDKETVLRVISGDDGHEIATHPDVIFELADDLGAAKVNHDEYPEIVVSTKTNQTLILNLVPKAGGGYEFKTVATLSPASKFARFANLDGGEYPQIITSTGIIEYTENNGKGEYKWRCTGNFGRSDHFAAAAVDVYTAADLDGDGEMELVGSNIYNKNCEKISEDSVYGGTVLADLDLVEDHGNGRLDVEQIGFVHGGLGSSDSPKPPPGKIATYKIFKTAEGKFRREKIWEKDMPIDYAYAENFMKSQGYKYPDGSSFLCGRAYSNNLSDYTELRRRQMCSTGGGPLVVADFDGDHKPDIGLVTTWSFVIFTADGNVLWADFTTQDWTSRVTGASLFDFEGDGVAEVLYADEVELHVYRGPGSGVIDPKFNVCSAELLIDPIPNTSGTIVEYPIVVDVDNDGHSEIIVTANDYWINTNNKVTGIRAFADPGNHWVRTRRIWNQYDYHVTNINEDGTVPKEEVQNWKHKKLNNFRQNIQPSGLFNAPNLVASAMDAPIVSCADEKYHIKLSATIVNEGSLGVKPGVSVKFYLQDYNASGQRIYIGEAKTQKVLTPGNSDTVTYDWNQKVTINGQEEEVKSPAKILFVVDEKTDEKPNGDIHECKEDDNARIAQDFNLCKTVN